MASLREKHTISVTTACLHLLQLLCTAWHEAIPTTEQTLANNNHPKVFNVSVFFTAYMIVHYLTLIFETMGNLQQAVIGEATPLLVTFEQL